MKIVKEGVLKSTLTQGEKLTCLSFNAKIDQAIKDNCGGE